MCVCECVCVCVRTWGNINGDIVAQIEKVSCLLVSVSFQIKCVSVTVCVSVCECVCVCVCVVCACVCNHSDFLLPIRALIHQLAVAMVFLSPPNQSQASEQAQRGESHHNFNNSL